jgi:hypothetical protein
LLGALAALVVAGAPAVAAGTVTVPPVGTTSTGTTSSIATAPATTSPVTTKAPATTKQKKAAPARATTAAKAKIRVYLPDAWFVNSEPVTIPSRRLTVGGVVRPFVPGQWVTVRAFLGNHLIKSDKFRLKRSRNGAYGRFTTTVLSSGVGEVTVYVRHARTSKQVGFAFRRGFASLDPNVSFGSTGRFVELIQQQLQALHFYLPFTGVYDEGTGLAIDAYHRLLGWGTYQTLDAGTITWLLNGWGEFKVHYPGHGTHAEGNLSNQLLALINGSKVYWILPISSGKPSTPTVTGNFQIYRRVPYFRPDGMYFSSYFYGGYAIHGYNPAPDYPASHGCMRLPMVDAVDVYNWLNYGDGVDVYY